MLLQGLSENRDSRVHGVTDDQEHSIRAVGGTGVSQTLDNTSVGVEQIITSHARLAGNAGRDHNNLAALQSISNLLHTNVTSGLGTSADVGDISSNTRCSNNIEQRQLSNLGIQLQQQSQGLANASTGTQDSDLVASQTHTGNISGQLVEHFARVLQTLCCNLQDFHDLVFVGTQHVGKG